MSDTPETDESISESPLSFRLTRRHALVAASLTMAAAASSSFTRFGSNAQETAERPVLPGDAASPIASPVPDLDDALLAEVIVELAEAGIAVYNAAGDAEPLLTVDEPGPVSLLMSQVRPMVREAMLGGGVLGLDLDALVTDRPISGTGDSEEFTLSDELPEIDGRTFFPPSMLVASYISTVDTPGAALVRRFRLDITIDHAATQQIPSLGMILFAAEVAREHATSAGMTPVGVRALVPSSIQGGICSQIQSFVDNTINSLFSALTIDLGTSPELMVLSNIINGIILGAKIPLKAALESVTKPVLDIIRDVAGVLGMAATVVSAIRPWTLQLDPEPRATRLAIGAEPGLPGVVKAHVDLGGLDAWPVDIADCAATSGVPLPPLKPENARCSWVVTGSRQNLVFTDELPTALDKDAKAMMKYHTLSESEDVAKGKLVTGWVQVTAIVARPEIDDLKKTVANLLFAQLPAIVNQFARPILGPIVDQLLGKLTSLTDSRSTTMFAVTYHNPPDETPTAEPEPTSEAGKSIEFSITAQEEIFPVSIDVSASSCDGEAWIGEVHLSFHPVFGNAARSDFEASSDLMFDFGGGDVATTSVGPYNGTLDTFSGTRIPVSYVFDLTVTREVDENEAETLTFDVIINATVDGDLARNPLVGATNVGVPIPVVEGGVVCAGEV
ncbi:MAG: hypothetical protein ACRDHN_18085 [Thermomicrobiales bacterium]